jgi:hypothetical protein
LGRRSKPSRWQVNWTIVFVAGLLTLGIGIAVVLLTSNGQTGRIVVPQPTSSVTVTPSAGQVSPAAKTKAQTTVRATTLPGSASR